jgi:integrase
MPTDTLTDARCKSAKPGDKPRKLFDGGGLYLWISTTGAKAWRVAYRLHGKPQTISFGPYPGVSLAEARRKRDALKATLRDGADPMAARKPAKAGMTLETACGTYWQGRNDLTDAYRANALRALEMHLWPALGARAIGSITRDDLMGCLEVMDKAGRYVYVRKVRMWVSQVFDWALERGEATSNPAGAIKPEKAFGRRPVESFAALELREVGPLLQRLALERDLPSVAACRLQALTWVRPTEARMMRWGEIDGTLWRIPGARMKRGRDHLVPLSRQALELLAYLRTICRGSEYVMPAAHRIDRPLSENAVLYLLHRIGYKGQMTAHGWRSVASTWANEHGYSPDAIERQLAHAPDDKVRATYNRAEFMVERVEMVQAWADWLDEQLEILESRPFPASS